MNYIRVNKIARITGVNSAELVEKLKSDFPGMDININTKMQLWDNVVNMDLQGFSDDELRALYDNIDKEMQRRRIMCDLRFSLGNSISYGISKEEIVSMIDSISQ